MLAVFMLNITLTQLTAGMAVSQIALGAYFSSLAQFLANNSDNICSNNLHPHNLTQSAKDRAVNKPSRNFTAPEKNISLLKALNKKSIKTLCLTGC